MPLYKHLLLAIDFSDFDQQIAAKALKLAELYQAKLSLIHVVDNLSFNDSAYGSEVFSAELMDELLANAKQRLFEFADQHHIPQSQCRVELGSPKLEIVRCAEQEQMDLIVLGSHSRNFFQELLLGSTANGVLHHASCDVLAVRLQQQKS